MPSARGCNCTSTRRHGGTSARDNAARLTATAAKINNSCSPILIFGQSTARQGQRANKKKKYKK